MLKQNSGMGYPTATIDSVDSKSTSLEQMYRY